MYLFISSLLLLSALTDGNGESKAGPPVDSVEWHGLTSVDFEPNHGQLDPRVQFFSRGPGYILFFTREELVLKFAEGSNLRVTFPGSNSKSEFRPLEELPGKRNYLIGNQQNWRTDIPTFAKLRRSQIYPGIDIFFYGCGGNLEYDFVIEPGSDPSRIQMAFSGADQIKLDSRGDLKIRIGDSEATLHRPSIYQELGGKRVPISGSFAIWENRISFRVEPYDRTQTLIIDPVLTYSTFLGGSAREIGFGIAADPAGHAYVTGYTESLDFPSAGKVLGTGGNRDVFVAKLIPTGSAFLYVTYLGGNAGEWGRAIAVDPQGHAYVTGHTNSSDFPTVNAVQTQFGGTVDSFVAKLNPDGSKLLFSTFLGGDKFDEGEDIAVSQTGSAYVIGRSFSNNFPTVNALQPSMRGAWDVFVTRFSSSGSELVFSTYLGGSRPDWGNAIAIDDEGHAVIAGSTDSEDFPLVSPLQRDRRGENDAFVAKITASGTNLFFSTFWGGRRIEFAHGVALDREKNIYVAGNTGSPDFPLVNSLPRKFRETEEKGFINDVFLTKLSPGGQIVLYSSRFGGSDLEVGLDLAVNPAGEAFIAGGSNSQDFPLVNPHVENLSGGRGAFLAKLSASGSSFEFSTILENQLGDLAFAIDLDPDADIYLVGHTFSPRFPVLSAAQPNYGGDGDAFAAKLIEPKRIHFAHFAAGSGAGVSLTGQILLVNPHPLKRARASLQIRDDAGVPMTIDLNGTVVRGGTDVEIAPLGVASLRSVGFSPLQAGSISILSDRDLTGVILFGGSAGLAGIANSPLLKRFAASVRTRNQVINTGIALTNLDGEQTIELELRNQQGAIVARSNLKLGVRSHLVRFITEIEWDRKLDFSDFSGVLLAAGTAELTATVLQTRPSELVVIPVVPIEAASSAASQELLFPQLADGTLPSGASIRSEIVLFDPSGFGAEAVLEIRNEFGNPLDLELNGRLISGAMRLEIPPHGTATLTTGGKGVLKSGSAVVASNRAIAGVVIFEGPLGAAGVSAGKPLKQFMAPIETGKEINTGIALMALEADQTLTLELRDPQGRLIARAGENIKAKSRLAKLVTEFNWDTPPAFSTFLGTLKVSSSTVFAATAIRMSPGQFATFPVHQID